MSSNPAFASLARYSDSSSAPATHPIHSSTLRRISEGTAPRTTTSETANRPPGFKTRKRLGQHSILVSGQIYDAVRDDDIHRIAWERDMLDLTLQELDVHHARLPLVLTGKRQHLISHVESVGLARRADSPG